MIIADPSGRCQSQTCLVYRVEAEMAFPGFCDTGPEGGWVSHRLIKIFCCPRDDSIVEKRRSVVVGDMSNGELDGIGAVSHVGVAATTRSDIIVLNSRLAVMQGRKGVPFICDLAVDGVGHDTMSLHCPGQLSTTIRLHWDELVGCLYHSEIN